jgi:hypothetical protein
MINKPTRIELPKDDDKWLHFKNLGHAMRVPAVVYADFETMLVKIQNCPNSGDHSYTTPQEKHELMSFCFILVLTDGQTFEPECYQGPNAASIFIQKIKKVAEFVRELYKKTVPLIPMTREEIERHESTTVCAVYGKIFENSCEKIRDHCHLTGKYRAALHYHCNLQFRLPKFVPVFS